MIITGKKFSKPEMSRVINGDRVLDSDEEKPEKFRLDLLLVEKFPEFNRSTLQSFIKLGFVTVDGKPARKPNEKYEKSAELSLEIPEEYKKQSIPRPPVIFEDENVLVLDKPAGLLSMAKGEFCPEPTLEDFGLLVHRLDRDTSGVVILAKNEETQSFLRRQFQDRKAHKTYYAVVSGRPKLDEAKIDLPIARDLKHPTKFRIDPNGKPSTTFYKVLRTNENLSLLELRPVTGRTHQLRVHLKYLGTPILGDPVYGVLSADATSENLQGSNGEVKKRLFLHAKSLEITIPGTPENLRKTFESPLPKEFTEIFERGESAE